MQLFISHRFSKISLFLTPHCITLFVLVEFCCPVFLFAPLPLTSVVLFAWVILGLPFATSRWSFSFVSVWISYYCDVLGGAPIWLLLSPRRLHSFDAYESGLLGLFSLVFLSTVFRLPALCWVVSTGSIVCSLRRSCYYLLAGTVLVQLIFSMRAVFDADLLISLTCASFLFCTCWGGCVENTPLWTLLFVIYVHFE